MKDVPVLRTALHALKAAEVARSPSPEGTFSASDEQNLAMSAVENEAMAESLLLGLAS